MKSDSFPGDCATRTVKWRVSSDSQASPYMSDGNIAVTDEAYIGHKRGQAEHPVTIRRVPGEKVISLTHSPSKQVETVQCGGTETSASNENRRTNRELLLRCATFIS